MITVFLFSRAAFTISGRIGDFNSISTASARGMFSLKILAFNLSVMFFSPPSSLARIVKIRGIPVFFLYLIVSLMWAGSILANWSTLISSRSAPEALIVRLFSLSETARAIAGALPNTILPIFFIVRLYHFLLNPSSDNPCPVPAFSGKTMLYFALP